MKYHVEFDIEFKKNPFPGKLIDLPNETPTVATVTDSKKLKDQPFFSKVENGDKVLIFTKAKKAILFRPSTNKILDVAPLTITNNQNPAQVAGVKTETPTPTPSPRK